MALFKQTLDDLRRQGIRVVDPLDLVGIGLIGLERITISTPPEETVREAASQGIIIQPSSKPKPTTIAEVRRFIASKPQVVGPIADPAPSLPKTPLEFLASERTRTIACGIITPFLLRGIVAGNPIVQGAALAGLALCGFEFAEDL